MYTSECVTLCGDLREESSSENFLDKEDIPSDVNGNPDNEENSMTIDHGVSLKKGSCRVQSESFTRKNKTLR